MKDSNVAGIIITAHSYQLQKLSGYNRMGKYMYNKLKFWLFPEKELLGVLIYRKGSFLKLKLQYFL